MFGHLLQVSCLSYDFGSAFKQFTLVSGYTQLYDIALSLGSSLHWYFYAVMSQEHSPFHFKLSFVFKWLLLAS